MHKTASEIERHVNIPLLHIADSTGERIRAEGLSRIGLLGTSFTMEDDFYKGRLSDQHDLDVIVPDRNDRDLVHRVIYDELCLGEIRGASKEAYRRIIESLVRSGAQGVILGCTEIGLMIGAKDSPVPVFDTTRIHAEAAVEFALV